MSVVTVQEAEVTIAAHSSIYIEITPAVNTTQVQQVGVARAGETQTITIRPVE